MPELDLHGLGDTFAEYIENGFYEPTTIERGMLWTEDNPDLNDVRKIWKVIKETIDKIKSILDNPIKVFKDIYEKIDEPQNGQESVYDLIARYLLNEKFLTRLGVEIARPDINIENLKEEYLTILLDIFRIVFDWNIDKRYELEWLGEADENEENKIKVHRNLAKKFGDLSDSLSASIGRSITTAIPDQYRDAKEIVPFFMGLVGRKKAEIKVQEYINKEDQG